MIAATTPPRTDGTTTVFTISHRVAPSPIDPSSSSDGTPMKSSRQIDDVIGIVMIVSTMIAVNTVDSVCGSPPKIGIQPSTAWIAGCDVVGIERREHVDPPEADDDRGDGGEHVDQRPDRRSHRRRCELAEEEADRDRDRS